MPATAKFQVVVLWSHELQLAAKALEQYRALLKRDHTDAEFAKVASDALEACNAALIGAEREGVSLIVTDAPILKAGGAR
jgi:hypothetical protein